MISEEAVEAALSAFAEAPHEPPTSVAQVNLNNRAQMAIALEAATPYLMATARTEIAEANREHLETFRDWKPGDPVE